MADSVTGQGQGKRKMKMKMKMKEFYAQWIETLKKKLLPPLEQALQNQEIARLVGLVERLHLHLEAYFDRVERAAEQDVLQVLSPAWRSAVEKPYLWIGDCHPALFINLFFFCATAQKNHGSLDRIEKIQRVMGSMVPALFARMRNVQLSLGNSLPRCLFASSSQEEALQTAIAPQLRELTQIFLDANRLRRNVVSEILTASEVCQAAHFLQGVAHFYVSFTDLRS